MKARYLPLKKEYVVAYDASCGPCTRFRQLVDALDTRDKIDFMSLVKADEKGLLDSVRDDLRYKSFHLIFLPSGYVKSGSDGLLALIAILPGGKIASPTIKYFPAGRNIVRFLYATLSKLHDRGSCKITNENDRHER